MKKMVKPEIEFIRFNAEDVITTSGGGGELNVVKFATTSTPVTATEADVADGKSQQNYWNELSWNQ